MFLVAIGSVLPVCLLLLLGFCLGRCGFLPQSFFDQLNKLGFWVLLPCLLFSTVAHASTASGTAGIRIGAVQWLCAVVVTGLSWLAARQMHLAEASSRSLMQSAMRGNLAYLALPILIYTYGEGTDAAASAMFALVCTIPFYNVLAVLILTRKGQGGGRLACLASVARNPLIIACLAGLACLFCAVRVPAMLMRGVNELGKAALPCSLVALGAGMTPERLHVALWPATVAMVLKLLAMPLIGFAIARACGMRGNDLLTAVLYLATPCAVNSYVMADQMGADRELAGAAIVMSTVCCLPVMTAVLMLLR